MTLVEYFDLHPEEPLGSVDIKNNGEIVIIGEPACVEKKIARDKCTARIFKKLPSSDK